MEVIPNRLEFKEISIEDRETLDKYFFRCGRRHCDCSFASDFCYSHICHYKWCIIDGFLCIKYLSEDKRPEYAFPLGDGDAVPTIRRLEEDAAECGEKFVLTGIPEDGLEKLREHFSDWGFAPDRRYADYIYQATDLKELKGKKYQQKRNHVNKFASLYPYRCVELGKEQFKDCLELEKKWLEKKIVRGEGIPENQLEEELTDEQIVIRTALNNFQALGLEGCALYVGDEMVAFTMGSELDNETFCSHVEKADIAYEGAYAMINREMAARLAGRYKYIDREWDGGIEGLRKAKLSYHPVSMSQKIIGRALTQTESEVRDLWLECFTGDCIGDADSFILNGFNEDRMLYRREDGRLVSMLHIIPLGETAYIFAVATSRKYRSRGFAGALLKEAVSRCRKEGFKRMALIPSENGLRSWYEKFGFSGSVKMEFDPQAAFCYGTGKPENDLAMTLEFSEVSRKIL